jgi:hypothetical protein
VSGASGDEDLTFEAVVSASRDELVAIVLRRSGRIWGMRTNFGSVDAWNTEAGFRLRRKGFFRPPTLMSLEAAVVDRGADCHVTGRVGWDPWWRLWRLGYAGFGLVSSGACAYLMVRDVVSGNVIPERFAFYAIFAVVGLAWMVSVWRLPRNAAANRAFLIEWLEDVIGPVSGRPDGPAA